MESRTLPIRLAYAAMTKLALDAGLPERISDEGFASGALESGAVGTADLARLWLIYAQRPSG